MSKLTNNENDNLGPYDWMLAIDFDVEISKVLKKTTDTLAKILFE